MPLVTIQRINNKAFSPASVTLRKWAKAVLDAMSVAREVTIRVVDENEMTVLNGKYRQKPKPTNVLSFPCDMPGDIVDYPLGDIIICAEVVNREAKEQNKTRDAHWAHMVVHGVLHLLGYDHENEIDANKMEKIEIDILSRLKFKNPYGEIE